MGLVDISDLDSVTAFANWFKETFANTTLHVLINNAGIHLAGLPDGVMYDLSVPAESKQGYDLVFATNYLGHFLLTELLLPHISDRVVNVASTYHQESDGTFLSAEGGSPPSASLSTHSSSVDGLIHRLSSYGDSKLAQVLHSKELARRLQQKGKSGLRILSVCPGWVNTGILSDNPLGSIVRSLAFSVEAGILSLMFATFSDSMQNGEFVTNMNILPFLNLSPEVEHVWVDALLSTATTLHVRYLTVNTLAGVLLLFQKMSYGVHVMPSSEVSRDPKLASSLYEWSLGELKAKNYL